MRNIKIQNYSILGYGTMQSDWWVPRFWPTYCLYLLKPWKIGPVWPSKTFITTTRLPGVLTQTAVWILTTLSTSNPIPKNTRCILKRGWKCHIGKNEWPRAACFPLTQYITLHTYSTNCVHSTSYFTSQTNWGNEIWNTTLLQTLSVYIQGPRFHDN
jgi:hypothetical protein